MEHPLEESIDACNPAELDKLTREMHLERYNWAYRRANETFRSSHLNILDAASGRGYGTRMLSTFGHATGVDISKDALTYARENYSGSRVKFIHANIEEGLSSHIPPNSMDVVVSFETLEHMKNPSVAIANLYGCMKQGGLLLASVPNGINEGKYNGASSNPFHHQMYTHKSFGKLLTEAGFDTLSFSGQAPIFGMLMRYIRGAETPDPKTFMERRQGFLRKVKRKIFDSQALCDILTAPRKNFLSTADTILVEARK